jgi:hypothetical protein
MQYSVTRPTFAILKSKAKLPLFLRVYINVIKDFFLFKVATPLKALLKV